MEEKPVQPRYGFNNFSNLKPSVYVTKFQLNLYFGLVCV